MEAKIKGSIGFVARDRHGNLSVFRLRKPVRDEIAGCWLPVGFDWLMIDRDLFPSLKWEDEPKEIKLQTLIQWNDIEPKR